MKTLYFMYVNNIFFINMFCVCVQLIQDIMFLLWYGTIRYEFTL